MEKIRSAGILMPISSLPSNYGIGTLGKCAYEFVDFLVKANQSYWQVLPIGPTSYGDSPYQSFSSFAGNPYFIDLDILVEEGLLNPEDLYDIRNDYPIDYGYLYSYRFNLLHKAYLNGKDKYANEFEEFKEENKEWLDDYSLFMAVKKHFGQVSWLDWPEEDIRNYEPKARKKYNELLKDDKDFYAFIQFLFYRQYTKLKEYAKNNGIKMIGDLPIYVALDSCDVWANFDEFQLDKNTKTPKDVAGVPPDYFSDDGQLWGNPLYDWKYMKKNNYKWWKNRIKGVSKFFDVIRIDHFRGFEEYWSVPFGEKTARNGHWEKGPSHGFIKEIKKTFTDVDFIAEDLGVIDHKVNDLLEKSEFPGMRVLEFGTSYDGTSYHCPHNHIENCVCYVTTHDNIPIMGWLSKASDSDVDYVRRYYGLNHEEGYNFGYIRGGMASICKLFICQIQDYLGLGDEGTMNNPGTLGNWKWRINKDSLNDDLAYRIATITTTYNRGRR